MGCSRYSEKEKLMFTIALLPNLVNPFQKKARKFARDTKRWGRRFKRFRDSEFVWGPAISLGSNDITDAAMFIVKNHENESDEEEYTISIRGTNTFSLSSWLCQDFKRMVIIQLEFKTMPVA